MATLDAASIAILTCDLATFHGTVSYHRNSLGLLYTDGIKYLAERAGAFWLIDLVESYQHRLRGCGFQLWELTVDLTRKTAIIGMREDSTEPIIVAQKIPYTDFPLASFAFYCVDRVMLLKGEY